MADENIKQVMLDAILDADSLERFINGSDSETVLTRLSAEYPTLQKAIKQMFESGGLPATPFKSRSEMQASSLQDGSYAVVTEGDPLFRGLYQKDSGTWERSAYDTLRLMQETVRDSLQETEYKNPWETGSFGYTSPQGSYWNDPKDRARLQGFKHYAANSYVRVQCLDENLVVSMVEWDADGFIHKVNNAEYSTIIEHLVGHSFNLVVKTSDGSNIDADALDSSKVRVSMLPVIGYDFIRNTEKLQELLAEGFQDPEWERGSITLAGIEANDSESLATRIRTKERHIPLVGALRVEALNPLQSTLINKYDSSGELEEIHTWSSGVREVQVNGFYNVVVSWLDKTDINIEDVDISIRHVDSIGRVPLLEASLTDLSNTINPLADQIEKYITKGEFQPSEWINGSFTNNGAVWDANNNRLRLKEPKNPVKGYVTISSSDPNLQVKLGTYDKNGNLIKFTGYSSEYSDYVDGFFNVVLRWADDSPITPEAAVGATITVSRVQPQQESSQNGLDLYNIPRFSTTPFGHLVGKSLPELQTAFDDLVSSYHGETLKEDIGKTTDGLYDMHAYTLTPPDYEATVALAMHTHGNERYNPLGFFALLHEMTREGRKHTFVNWLKDKVRWIVVPFASPTSIVKNTRSTGSVNLNRNYDYLWDLWGSSEKGPAVNSLKETQNISRFFKPKADEIDFFMDLHDIPGGGGSTYSHRPGHAPYMYWLDEFQQVRAYLAEINQGRDGGNYPFDGGGTTNFFLGSLAVPALTPEHVTQHWLRRGLTPDQQIAKAMEQTCANLFLFKHKFDELKHLRNNSFYSRELEVAFASKEAGLYSWGTPQIKTAFEGVSFLNKDLENDVFVHTAEPNRPTILVLSGAEEDDNNSDLTVLRVMQRIEKDEFMYVSHLKKCNLVVVPALRENASVVDRIRSLQDSYKPDYCLLVTAAGLHDPLGNTIAYSSSLEFLTQQTSNNKEIEVSLGEDEWNEAFQGRFTRIALGNEVPRHAVYPHTVAKWVGLVANDMASYFASNYY